jgi:hypothetical protein
MEMNRKTIKQQKRVGEQEDGKWEKEEGEVMRVRMVWLALWKLERACLGGAAHNRRVCPELKPARKEKAKENTDKRGRALSARIGRQCITS